ncbi:single-stranded-DNA-specific exonuclease RecJ [Roseimicrobium sp. ORNL1]|uniref:single-stranded-DNA-specific exonuclease RecJ n=1 Tax=Roseimicrobium sp. ORNL1 TaxID=2711231 RepID=UPI0013E1B1E5|nr:single-stranded-DNA-specific exonuclease RecJ [Roseimicrobium sp. ORNL1]QIF00259.1 single-stranded-DNA-specific exonuclease RecJ [Roseimicrobium sp. ORNL1]
MSSAPAPLWSLQSPDAAVVQALAQGPLGRELNPLLLHLLALRGHEVEALARTFLNPRLSDLGDPFVLPNMQAAVERIFQAVDKKESVVLYGDYDVDGVTSITLLTHTLRAYGLDPRAFLPLRMEEGYGLSLDGLARCFERHGKPDLLIALDCGTGSVAEADWLKAQGVECIIVDHHEPTPRLPECAALVNPKLQGEGGPFTYLCTVGLVFKLAHALLKTRRLEHFDLKDHLDLVAMGTVADLVPLKEENRALVRKGLDVLGATRCVGLKALKDITGLDGFVQAHHIGFRLGPRLNAAGRLDTAQTALDLLLCTDPQEANEFASLLDLHNRERQEVENTVQREAQAMLASDPTLAQGECIVLGSRGWHPGVVGIVASRLMREYHRPVLMLAFDENGMGKGSGRSVAGISLVAALDSCRHLLDKGGGHPMAVGVALQEGNLAAFRSAMIEGVRAQIRADELAPRLHLDAEIRLADLAPPFFDGYARMEPFGMGNPEPVFLCRGVEPNLPGQVLKEKHWKLMLRQGKEVRPAMWFNAPVKDAPPSPWDVAIKVQRHSWRGQVSWQLMICEVRTAE